MEAETLIDSFADFARNKNIDRPTMIRILEDVFRTMIRKNIKMMIILILSLILIKGIWKFGDLEKLLMTILRIFGIMIKFAFPTQ